MRVVAAVASLARAARRNWLALALLAAAALAVALVVTRGRDRDFFDAEKQAECAKRDKVWNSERGKCMRSDWFLGKWDRNGRKNSCKDRGGRWRGKANGGKGECEGGAAKETPKPRTSGSWSGGGGGGGSDDDNDDSGDDNDDDDDDNGGGGGGGSGSGSTTGGKAEAEFAKWIKCANGAGPRAERVCGPKPR